MITVQPFFDKETFTLTYVVWDSSTLDGVVIDPVWNYLPASSSLSLESVTEVATFLKEKKIRLHWILESHAHADHISGAQPLKNRFPSGKTGIGERITEVQKTFQALFDLKDLKIDGSQFDHLWKDHDHFRGGSLSIQVLSTPGHTPACCSYLIEDAVFTGDCLFMPDSGTGRCDFPQGSADMLYTSVAEVLYSLPDSTRVFVGHDYQPGGRELKFQSTIGEEKASNVQLSAKTDRSDYIRFRTQRDSTLSAPRLLLPSIQLNIDGGHLPKPHSNGKYYLTLPIFPT